MEGDRHILERKQDPICPNPDLTVALRTPLCILISAGRDAAWGTARRIAHGCGSGLSWIDCDTVEPAEMGDLLRDHVVFRAPETVQRILYLREVQVLTPENQLLLNDLIASRCSCRSRPRLIASSSLSLYDCVRAGIFDEALFYKLNAVHIAL